jgi:hypothetical protein
MCAGPDAECNRADALVTSCTSKSTRSPVSTCRSRSTRRRKPETEAITISVWKTYSQKCLNTSGSMMSVAFSIESWKVVPV